MPSPRHIGAARRSATPPTAVTVPFERTHLAPRVHPLAVLVMVVSLVVIVASALTVFGAYRTAAGVSADSAGHVMVEPGRSLWQVAVETAPAGVPPSEHYEALQELNGHAMVRVDGWHVVLLPAY